VLLHARHCDMWTHACGRHHADRRLAAQCQAPVAAHAECTAKSLPPDMLYAALADGLHFLLSCQILTMVCHTVDVWEPYKLTAGVCRCLGLERVFDYLWL
jgi:hypothetical protein